MEHENEEVKIKMQVISEALSVLFGENTTIVLVRDKDGQIHAYGDNKDK